MGGGKTHQTNASGGRCFQDQCQRGGRCFGQRIEGKNDAIVLCGGAEDARDLPIPGRDLEGIYQAMFFLPQQNRRGLGQTIDPKISVTAKGKRVIILGGGDTGSDCLGTANRQGAVWVKQYELLPRPPEQRALDNPWPNWAFVYRKSSSHEEGVQQDYSIMTKQFSGENGQLKKLRTLIV